MLINIDVTSWPAEKVRDWLIGVCDSPDWLDVDKIIRDNIDGKELLNITCQNIERLGLNKVCHQENILEAIERLRYYNFNLREETLQAKILRLSCQARSLNRQLNKDRNKPIESPKSLGSPKNSGSPKSIAFSNQFKYNNSSPTFIDKREVTLDTLASVCEIVNTAKDIVDILKSPPFCKLTDYISIKGLIIEFSIALTITAQRGPAFVERPNDFIEEISKKLADHCDKTVLGYDDPLLIQPFQIESVRIRKDHNDSELGLTVRSAEHSSNNVNIHFIDSIAPLSPAKKTNKLNDGDEIIQLDQFILGWTSESVRKLMKSVSNMREIVMIVKKSPKND